MIIIDKQTALYELRPNSEWTWVGDNYSDIEWFDENETLPTEQEILDKQAELQADYDAKDYQRNRAKAYPSLQEQLDMQYWDKVNGTNNWETKIAEIKALYPKPTE